MNTVPYSQSTSNFANNLAFFGEAVALIQPDGVGITYKQLAGLCDDFADNFTRLAISHSHLCALQCSNNLSTVVAYLACLRQQRPLLLLDAELPAPQLKVLSEQLQIAALIDNKGQINKLSYAKTQTRTDLALLLSTSGSSGSPKSVMLSLNNLQANALSISQYLPMQASDTAITSLPLHYSYGLSVLNSHLLIGAKILLCPFSLITKEFWHLMEQHQVNCLSGVPFNYQMLKTLRFERKQLSHLRYLTQAGGRLSEEQRNYVRQLGVQKQLPIYLMYGQTEATARIAYLPPELLQQHADCIGKPIPGGELLLRDPGTKNLITEDFIEGELCYRGPNVMLGYASCADDLTSTGVLTELSTGDLAERLPNGLYRIVGRLSRFLKIQGKRLQLDHLEQQLSVLTDPVCCAGTDDLLVVAYTQQEPALREQIQQLLREQLQLHPALYKVLQLDTLPVLSNGKADYQALLLLATESSHAN
jgi:long-chain acyl-CoA synthetase